VPLSIESGAGRDESALKKLISYWKTRRLHDFVYGMSYREAQVTICGQQDRSSSLRYQPCRGASLSSF